MTRRRLDPDGDPDVAYDTWVCDGLNLFNGPPPSRDAPGAGPARGQGGSVSSSHPPPTAPLTTDDVFDRLDAIRDAASHDNDPEKAASLERALLIEVLGEISKGPGRPGGLAAAALKVTSIAFPRWQA